MASAVMATHPALQERPTAAMEHDPRLAGMRVLIAHDWLVTWAGSERVVEQLVALFPDADIAATVVAAPLRDTHAIAARARELWVSALPGARTRHRWYLPLHPLAWSSLNTRGYDLVVSSSHAFAKLVRAAGGSTHVCYCHSPPRYLWDLNASYAAQARGIERLALHAATPLLRRIDEWGSRGVSRFVCNSRYVAERVYRHYGRESDVVPPPVAPKARTAIPAPRERFVLSLGRLVPYKRVDLAILAAERVGVPLIVAGDGPDRARLERLAGPQTTFVGAVDEAEAARLFDRCAAFVFCADEDFGIAPVEANAHGAPVVGFGRGGLTESMREGETAVFFHEQTATAVEAALRTALSRSWDLDALRENAARFGPAQFRARMTDAIGRAIFGATP